MINTDLICFARNREDFELLWVFQIIRSSAPVRAKTSASISSPLLVSAQDPHLVPLSRSNTTPTAIAKKTLRKHGSNWTILPKAQPRSRASHDYPTRSNSQASGSETLTDDSDNFANRNEAIEEAYYDEQSTWFLFLLNNVM